jgi:hypothetical protein
MDDPAGQAEERRRLAELARYQVLDTEAVRSVDDITRIVSLICGTPIALLSFINAHEARPGRRR